MTIAGILQICGEKLKNRSYYFYRKFRCPDVSTTHIGKKSTSGFDDLFQLQFIENLLHPGVNTLIGQLWLTIFINR